MKKYTTIAVFAAALLVAGCAKEMDGDGSFPAKTVLNASLSPLTRTEIDGVKVTWSVGDAINVNGTVSNALSEAGAIATFSFRKGHMHLYHSLLMSFSALGPRSSTISVAGS